MGSQASTRGRKRTSTITVPRRSRRWNGRSGPRALGVVARDTSEAALAALVALERGEEIVLAEVGPQPIGEVELGVCAAEEQEVRQALLPAGADDEVGIADGEARQPRLHERAVDAA